MMLLCQGKTPHTFRAQWESLNRRQTGTGTGTGNNHRVDLHDDQQCNTNDGSGNETMNRLVSLVTLGLAGPWRDGKGVAESKASMG